MKKNLKNCFKKMKIRNFPTKISTFFIACIAFVLLPIAAIVITPIFFVRYLVSILAKVFRSDFKEQVSVRSSVWTQDTIETSPSSNITATIVNDGNITREILLKEFKTKILQKRKISGALEYERLRQYYQYWWGFSFWVWDKEFETENHITYYQNEGYSTEEPIVGQQEIVKISNKVNREPWPLKRSPWRVVLVPNYREAINSDVQKSVWIFSIHHSLADAFAVQCLFNNLIGGAMKISVFNDITSSSLNNRNSPYYLPSLRSVMSLPFRAILEVIQDLKKCHRERNAFKLAETDVIKDRQVVFSEKIPIEHIQQLQDAHGVTFTTVLASAIGGGLKNFMEKRDAPIPNSIHIMFPYSHPGHTSELSNYQSFIFLEVPVAAAGNSLSRLRLMEKEVQSKKNSLLSQSYSIAPLVVGGMSGSVIREHYKILMASGVMITLRISPDEPIHFQGHKVDDFLFLSGPLPGSVGLFFYFANYNKGLKLGVCLSEYFSVSSSMAEELLDSVITEIGKLRTDTRF